jgi:glycosyltransferase involved in cell wall biosynthesis
MMAGMEDSRFLTDADLLAIPAAEISDASRLAAEPAVSVLMLAHNHAAFIDEAVESVALQKLGAPFEILIGEDASRDETGVRCREFQRRYPGLVRLVQSADGVGMHGNFARLWARARGRYVAVCEGDDYWTDRRKLAKQTAIMDGEASLSMCGAFTRRVRWADDGGWEACGSIRPSVDKARYGVADLIADYGFHTSSVLVRKEGLRFPAWMWSVYCVDRPLYLLCAERGPVACLPEYTSVYRMQSGSAWFPLGPLDKGLGGVALYERVNRHFGGRYRALIRRTLASILWSYAGEAVLRGDRAAGRRLFGMALRRRLPLLPASPLRTLKVAWRLWGPTGVPNASSGTGPSRGAAS